MNHSLDASCFAGDTVYLPASDVDATATAN